MARLPVLRPVPVLMTVAVATPLVAPAAAIGDDGHAAARALVLARCVDCHGEDAQESNLRLDTRAAMLRGGDFGPAAVAGKAGASELIRRITTTNPEQMMPPDGERLTAAEVAAVAAWIDAGLPWPGREEEEPVRDPRLDHWAWQPIERPSVPAAVTEFTARPGVETERDAIDFFIRQELAERGLAPAPAADRAALNALRRMPGFEGVLRKLVGMFGERAVRLTFKANAVLVSETQYSWIHERLLAVCDTLDIDEVPQVYVSQTPLVNAGAVGFDKPFIVLNSSLIEILDRDELEAVVAHEVGHIVSGHAVYRTMLFLLLQLADRNNLIAGIAIRPIIYALLEWHRKSELSCDRAGAIATNDPRAMMGALMQMAGGSRGEALELDAFIERVLVRMRT